MVIISNHMIINYLNCLQKAAASLRVSSSRQQQAAENFDVSPNKEGSKTKKHFGAWTQGSL